MAREIDKNRSYTNKDFQSIYEEMLDLVPKLTSKWNPSSSDEADPGVVLLKLMAVLGDKLNYNIDKQVLENFPLTVTQRKNARQLYDLIGYRMKWYRSARVKVFFKIISSDINFDIFINKFTQITDENQQISFVTTQDVTLKVGAESKGYPSRYTPVEVDCIQGVIQDLTVNNSKDIFISDLDENYRIYLPVSRVAENGIFVMDDYSSEPWLAVDNVDSYPLHKKIFTFVTSDDNSQPYIQFPVDVNNLLESENGSLKIRYIVTEGFDGNVNSGTLTNFADDLIVYNSKTGETNYNATGKVQIAQPLAAQFGADPETVEEAYRNSRRVIGTFNTLVTRLDYQNYIRRYIDANTGRPLVSNCVVADRTTDLNLAYRCAGLQGTQQKMFYGSKDSINGVDKMTPYDVRLYALQDSPIYDRQFMPITDAFLADQIEAICEEVKVVNYNFSVPNLVIPSYSNEVLYLFNNLYILKAQIVTVEKISEQEAQELEEKIKLALMEYYSAHNVDFGHSIDYNLLLERVQSIDPRIKSIALNTPEYQIQKTYWAKASTSPVTPMGDLSIDDKVNLVAKTVAAGNLQLFKFNDSFNKDFGQEHGFQDDLVKEISTDIKVELTEGIPYELRRNEVLQLLSPMYSEKEQYNIGVEVFIKESTASTIYKDRNVALNAPICVRWKDSEGVRKTTWIPEGTIIRTSFNFNAIESWESQEGVLKPTNPHSNGDDEEYKYWKLRSGQTLSTIKKNEHDIQTGTAYVLLLNKGREGVELRTGETEGKYTIKEDKPLILDTNEYFIYTNMARDEMLMLGSGTTIGCLDSPVDMKVWTSFDLQTFNYKSLQEFNWDYTGGKLNVVENEILSFAEGSIIKSELGGILKSMKSDVGSPYESQDWEKLSSSFLGVVNLDDVDYDYNDKLKQYYIRIRLHLENATGAIGLLDNQTIYYNDVSNPENFTSGTYTKKVEGSTNSNQLVSFNQPLLLVGGIINEFGKTYLKNNVVINESDLSLYRYQKPATSSIIRGSNGYITIEGGTHDNPLITELPFSFSFSVTGASPNQIRKPQYYFVPIIISGIRLDDSFVSTDEESNPAIISIVGSDGNPIKPMKDLISNTDVTSSTFSKNGAYILVVDRDLDELIFEINRPHFSIAVGDIFIAETFNEEEINVLINGNTVHPDYFDLNMSTGPTNNSTAAKDVLSRINKIATEITGAGEYNWTLSVPAADKCIQPTLSESYWNLNHPYNKYTIPQMDLDNFAIKVNPFSIRK